jgi:hypothetical protein
MAKKETNDRLGNAVNKTDDLRRQIVMETEVRDAEGDPRIGVMVIHTPAGHYQFLIAEPTANDIIQQLRDFIAGDSERLP